jgi:hypothetical protein
MWPGNRFNVRQALEMACGENIFGRAVNEKVLFSFAAENGRAW